MNISREKESMASRTKKARTEPEPVGFQQICMKELQAWKDSEEGQSVQAMFDAAERENDPTMWH
jgi:hypothetical protein